MKMLRTLLFVALGLVVFFIGNACGPDEVKVKGNGTLTLHFNPLVNGAELVPQTGIYTNSTQHVRYKVDMLQFYICNIVIKRSDDSIITLSGPLHVGLIKVMDVINKDFSVTLPVGDYKSIGFTLGLDAGLNATQPGDYATDHPLGLYSGNYWIMNSSYVFVKLEGMTDTTAAGTGSFTNSFVYHIGTNALGQALSFSKNFTISKDLTNTVNVNMDVPSMFDGVNTVNMRTEVSTNTTDNLVLAQKVITNIVASISIP